MGFKYLNRGTSLLEVLAAMFVLSVGALGVAGLQITGIRAGDSASQRNTVIIKSQEILERMRANPAAVRDGSYATPGDATVNCETEVCTPQQVAAYDMSQWNNEIQALLPGGMTNNTPIEINVAGPTVPVQVTVTLQWNERGSPKTYSVGTLIR